MQPARAPYPPALSVLIVEDYEDAAETLAVLLQMSGYRVTVVSSGEAALRAAAVNPPDVAVIDVGLPGMDGYTLAERLLERAVGKQPLLVAVTGHGRDEDRRRSAAAGIDLHLVKPLDPTYLLWLLARFAEAAAPADAATVRPA